MLARSPLACIAFLVVLLASSAAIAQQTNDIKPPLSVQWVFSMGPDPDNTTPPVIGKDTVYISHRGTAHCLDIITGGERWQFKPENAAVTTTPLIYGELAIVGANDGSLYALRAANGSVAWRFICAGPIAPEPIILNDMLVVGAGELVYTINPSNGQGGWVSPLQAPAKLGPVTDGSMLYFLATDGSVQCVDSTTGRYRWGTLLTPGIRVFAPVVAGSRVVVATGNRVYGVARSGAVAWTAEMPAAVGATPLVADEYLLVPGEDGEIYTLVARSGGPQRHMNFKLDHPVTSTPAATDTMLALGTGEGLIYTLDRRTGKPNWFYRCRDPEQLPYEANPFGIYAPVLINEGSLYCLVGSGDLYRFTASAPDLSGPAIGDFLPEPGSAMPGGEYVYPQCSVVDDGTGVDPNSIMATLDGAPTPVSFDLVTGIAALRDTLLPDGAHIVRITAKDFRGNEASTEWSFITEASLLPSPTQGASGIGAASPTY
jgi:outer membrane protein assembly factor BamB